MESPSAPHPENAQQILKTKMSSSSGATLNRLRVAIFAARSVCTGGRVWHAILSVGQEHAHRVRGDDEYEGAQHARNSKAVARWTSESQSFGGGRAGNVRPLPVARLTTLSMRMSTMMRMKTMRRDLTRTDIDGERLFERLPAQAHTPVEEHLRVDASVLQDKVDGIEAQKEQLCNAGMCGCMYAERPTTARTHPQVPLMGTAPAAS